MVWIVELEGVDSLYMHRLLSHFLFCRKVVKYICTNIFGILESTCESQPRQGQKGLQVGDLFSQSNLLSLPHHHLKQCACCQFLLQGDVVASGGASHNTGYVMEEGL